MANKPLLTYLRQQARTDRPVDRDLWPGLRAERLGLGDYPFHQTRLLGAGSGGGGFDLSA